MPKGALLDLVAHGIQDVYLIGNPTFSYFKKVYKRNTNFTMESIRCTFDGEPNFGNKLICQLPRNGDLAYTMFLEVDLPELTATGSDDEHSIQYIENVGQALIEYADVKIGGQLIDRQYGEWAYIWNELTRTDEKRRDYREMIKSTADNGPMTVYIPFNFWFNRHIGNALPLVALQYHPVEIEFTLRPLSKLYNFGQRNYYDLTFLTTTTISGTTYYRYQRASGSLFTDDVDGKRLRYNSGNSFYTITYEDPDTILLNGQIPTGQTTRVYVEPTYTLSGNPSITGIRFYVDYIYLDSYEKKYFANEEHRYLIEQVQFSEDIGISQSQNSIKTRLDFNLPVKELFWVLQTSEKIANNELLDFTNSPDNLYENPSDDILECDLLYNGNQRFEPRNGEYFRLIQPALRHTNSVFDKYIYVYSLAVNPEDHQPSGFSNFSKIDKIEMFLTLRNDRNYTSTLRIYALNYNVLRIAMGMGGVAFSN